MKRITLVLAFVLLLSACGQSNEERAKELVKEACALEGSGGVANPLEEPLIRQAVGLDEKYRPYLIAYLKWMDALWTMRNTEDPAIDAQAKESLNENFAIVDSYCNY
jgi:hypothetical protein